ncbi:MAG TPA: right-handed parallel beta-helix repeat-containing protein [Kofleriaceae bacterium]|nr:right-handed parallel beta-helix repeat-containing protein [Kofleriaceae bacterium]
MRITWLLFFIVATGCTKPNPNLCCTDEADCASAGLAVGTSCDDGLVCRGNQCIAELCASSAECEASAPYCVINGDGRCQEACTADSECPGFGQSPAQQYCEAGSCVQCRSDADCDATTPVCSGGACRGCEAHDECATGACHADGTCAVEAEIAHVSLTGSATADCTLASPCSTIERTFQLTPARHYVLIEPGTYTRASTLDVNGIHHLIGHGGKPIITRSTQGPIVTSASGGVDVTFENLEISGAKGPATGDLTSGWGVRCNPTSGAPILRFYDTAISANSYIGVDMRNGCSIEAVRSSISNNGNIGLSVTDGSATLESCSVVQNAFLGVHLDIGAFDITNSIIARNGNTGLDLFTTTTGTRVEHNTIADNAGTGFNCSLQGITGTFPNNIIARNTTQLTGLNCTYPSSIIVDTDVAPIKFVSPNTAPFDYHIAAGSIAVDVANPSAIDHDIDGDARPQGAGRDVGADELTP